MTMRLAMLGAAVAACLTGGAATQKPDLLSIYVEAPSLWTSARDYVLKVDNAVVPIAKAAPGPQALSAIVLLDVSDSLKAVPLEGVTRRIAGGLRAGDVIRVASFAEKILVSQTILVDRPSASKAAREVSQRGGPSPLWDAICESVGAVPRSQGMRTVLVHTDGLATGNDRGFDDAYGKAVESGVVVSAVGLGDDALRFSSRIRIEGRNEGIRRIVDATGGTYLQLERRTDTPIYGVTWALDRLRKSYRLDFSPPVRDGRVHQVSVTLAGNAVRAPARVRF